VDVPLAGDARATLAALLPQLPRNEDRSFPGAARHGRLVTPEGRARHQRRRRDETAGSGPRTYSALSPGAIVCGESGTLLDSG
jgi:pyruvate dehydrogenase (quinone)